MEDSGQTSDLNIVSSTKERFDRTKAAYLDGTFFEFIPDKSNEYISYGLCMKCPPHKRARLKGFNNSSSNFLTHLKRKHGENTLKEYREYAKRIRTRLSASEYGEVTDSPGSPFKTLTVSVAQFEGIFINFFIDTMIPLDTIEKPGFLRLISFTNDLPLSNFNINRKHLSSKIEETYANMLNIVKQGLKKVDYLCIVVEFWSRGRVNYLGVTAHWIANDCSRISVALTCVKMKNLCDYIFVYDTIEKVYADFEIDRNKVLALYFIKENTFFRNFRLFGIDQLNIEKTFESDKDSDYGAGNYDSVDLNYFDKAKRFKNLISPKPVTSRMQCSLTILTQCITSNIEDVLNSKFVPKNHYRVLQRCNLFWKRLNQNLNQNEIPSCLNNIHKPKEHDWNSLYKSLQSILNIKNQQNIPNEIKEIFKDSDFKYIKEYLTFSEPLIGAVDILQYENGKYFGFALPCYLALLKKIKRLEKSKEISECLPFVTSMQRFLSDQFKFVFEMTKVEGRNAAIAAISNPRFKNKWFSCLEPSQRDELMDSFRICIAEFVGVAGEIDDDNNLDNSGTKEAFFKFDSDSESDEGMRKRSVKVMKRTEAVLLKYLCEEDIELEALNKYPEVKKVFIKFNTPVPSSSYQKLFSLKIMNDISRGFYKPENLFEKRLVLKYNFSYFQK